jgi:hypothetical protein
VNPGPVLPDDERWEEEAADARHKSLDNVRATAKSWTESIGLILGAFTAVAFLKGPEALKDIPRGGFTLSFAGLTYEPAWAVIYCVLLAAVALLVALTLGALAAQGSPEWAAQLDGRRFAVASMNATKTSITLLLISRISTGVAAALILLGMGVAWSAEIQKPAAASATNAIVNAGGRPVCGALSTAGDGSLSVTLEGAVAAAVDAGSAVTIVDDCP